MCLQYPPVLSLSYSTSLLLSLLSISHTPVFVSILNSKPKHQPCLFWFTALCFSISLPAHHILPLGLSFALSTPIISPPEFNIVPQFYCSFLLMKDAVSLYYLTFLLFISISLAFLPFCLHSYFLPTSFPTSVCRKIRTLFPPSRNGRGGGRLTMKQRSERVSPACIFSYS
jgi:hypothetical protein